MNRDDLAKEAKALAVLCFRNGPVETIHSGIQCPVCAGKEEYSHLTQAQMMVLNKSVVNHLYAMLLIKESDPASYAALIEFGLRFTTGWDEPDLRAVFGFGALTSTKKKKRKRAGSTS